MVSSSISTIKATDGEDIIVFTRPRTKPDVILDPDSFIKKSWSLWLCDGYGDSPFVYVSYGPDYTDRVIRLGEKSGTLLIMSLNGNGSISKTFTAPYNRSEIHQEASRLLTDEIIRRTLLV